MSFWRNIDKRIKRLRIGLRLAFAFGVIIFFMFIGSAVGLWQLVQVRQQVQRLNQVSTEALALLPLNNDVLTLKDELGQLAEVEATVNQALMTIIATGLLTLLVAISLGALVIGSIAQPLARLKAAAVALARREFDQQLEVTGGDELAQLTEVFNEAAVQLAKLYTELESLVEEHTTELQRRVMQLETSLAVGHRITSILDLDILLTQFVELIKERYHYSFVGVFLLDETKEYVVARAGTGEAGTRLSRRRFRLKVGQEGVIGWVAAHRRPMRVDDVLEDHYYLPIEVIPETRSELALPLAMGKNLLGVLDIQSDQVRAFRLDDVPVLQSLADQVAIAIQNASLYEAERSRRQLTEALYQAGQAISSSLEPDEVLDLILEHLTDIVPYDRAIVVLQKRDELEVVAARGFPADMPVPVLRGLVKEDELFQHISQTQQPWAIPDLFERQDWPHIEGLARARSWLGVPLIRIGLVIGMLSLSRESPEPFRDDEIAVATTFAGQAAIALENARLYDKIFRFIQELEDMVRERTEAVQAAYSQLEHLDRTKSDFINVTAHELRTPLTLLRGYSQMLLKDRAIQENLQHLELISGIHSGALRLQEIVTSMLDIVKIDSRALKLYPEPVSVPSVIQLVAEELADVVAERKQTLIIVEEMTNLPYIEADPDALRKVFYHLIVNAIKYTPDGGTITISGRSVAPDDNFVWPGVELVVDDTGIGIDPEFHELIFTKFYQTGELALHSSGRTKFKGGGPGLGLAIARGIVEAHRGKLWVESEGYDEETYPGSRFHIFLPLRQAKDFQNGEAVEQATRPHPVSLN